MNYKVKHVLGMVLNVSCATFAGSTMFYAFFYGAPWLLLFTVFFLGLTVSGILLTRSADKERRAEYAESYRKLLADIAANPNKPHTIQ